MIRAASRPFYGQFAWAYDSLIDRAIPAECEAITRWLAERGVPAPATILDAGCGTGRYASALGRKGYIVRGIDRSPELIAEAKKSIADSATSVTFAVGDILLLSAEWRSDAILCRGVLNDVINPRDRQAVFVGFARALRINGVLILDVRDWVGTVNQKTREPVFEKSVTTSQGRLTFRSVTRLDHQNRQLLVAERHTLDVDAAKTVADYEFVMRCWTQDELHRHLTAAGFGSIELFGAYQPASPVGSGHRLVAVSSRLR